MKAIIAILFIFSVSLQFHSVRASNGDTTYQKRFFQHLNIAFQWFEIGGTVPLNQKRIESLNYGLDKFMAKSKGTLSSGFLGFSVYYKDMIGVEGIFNQHSVSSDGTDFDAYLTEKYPGYYLPAGIFRYSSSTNGYGLRMCYRKHFKHFFIEPKFQFMINSYENHFWSFRLKEIGTNQFVQYMMTDQIHGQKNSYHLILNIAKRFDPFHDILKFEFGLMAEFMIAPIRQSVSVTEFHYGEVAVTNTETFRLFNPCFNFGVTGKFFIGK